MRVWVWEYIVVVHVAAERFLTEQDSPAGPEEKLHTTPAGPTRSTTFRRPTAHSAKKCCIFAFAKFRRIRMYPQCSSSLLSLGVPMGRE